MRCKFCGREIKESSRFCPECGLINDQFEIVKPKTSLTRREKKGFLKFLVIGAAVFIAVLTAKSVKDSDHSADADWEENYGDEYAEIEEEYDVTEGGIHGYQCVLDDCSWDEAYRKSLEMGGHLVRINSPEEYDYILSVIEESGFRNIIFRLGGRRDSDSDNYYWVDENNNCYGESLNNSDYWTISQWKSGEPNFYDGDIEETCIEMYYNSDENRWIWNDIPNDLIAIAPYYSGRVGYIVEYE